MNRKRRNAYEKLANQIEDTVGTDCPDPNAFAVIIPPDNDSMSPVFRPNDRVVFAPNSEPGNGEAVIAKLNDGRVLFRVFHAEGKTVRLESLNPNYPPVRFKRSEFTFIYPAWELKRSFREVPKHNN